MIQAEGEAEAATLISDALKEKCKGKCGCSGIKNERQCGMKNL